MKKLVFAILLSAFAILGCQPQTECNCPKEPAPVAAETPSEVKADETKPEADAQPVATTAIEVGAAEIALPAPQPTKATLTDSLKNRRSIRAYTEDMISLEQLSALLWSANGISREDGKRTAPSAMNKQSVSIYVSFEKGTYKYDHVNHKLVQVSSDDVRPVKLAPVELIITSNHTDSEVIRGIDTGVVSENAALYCASEGLATVIRMMRGDQTELQKALKLEENDLPVFNMAIGFEKK